VIPRLRDKYVASISATGIKVNPPEDPLLYKDSLPVLNPR
jgi:hypothetical protein